MQNRIASTTKTTKHKHKRSVRKGSPLLEKEIAKVVELLRMNSSVPLCRGIRSLLESQLFDRSTIPLLYGNYEYTDRIKTNELLKEMHIAEISHQLRGFADVHMCAAFSQFMHEKYFQEERGD